MPLRLRLFMLGDVPFELDALIDPPLGLSLQLLPVKLQQLANDGVVAVVEVAELVELALRELL